MSGRCGGAIIDTLLQRFQILHVTCYLNGIARAIYGRVIVLFDSERIEAPGVEGVSVDSVLKMKWQQFKSRTI